MNEITQSLNNSVATNIKGTPKAHLRHLKGTSKDPLRIIRSVVGEEARVDVSVMKGCTFQPHRMLVLFSEIKKKKRLWSPPQNEDGMG